MKIIFLFLIILTSIIFQHHAHAQNIFDEGLQLMEAKKYVEADIYFTQLIGMSELPEDLKMAYIYKGYALNGQGKFDSAIICYNRALELNPFDAATFIDRGRTFAFKGDNDQAINDFKKVLTIDSTGIQGQTAWYYLGYISLLQWKNEEAIGYFDHLLQLSASDAEGYFLRGTAKSNLSKHEESITDYDTAINLKPDYMQAYANRGVSKLNKLPVEEKTGANADCIEDACKDLLKARELGDKSIDDLIDTYCRKCK